MRPKNVKQFPDFMAISSPLHLSWTHNRCLQLKSVAIWQIHTSNHKIGPNAFLEDKKKTTACLTESTLGRASDISRKKKAKFRGIFRGKFAEKSADFAGFSREKSQNSQKNRRISRDFSGKKSNFEGFSGQILRSK